MTARTALDRGREAYAGRAWGDAYASLRQADEQETLSADGLELLARAAYMTGREDEYVACLERAHHAHGDPARAVRCAFWIVLTLLLRGETGRATGWLGRGRRVLAREESDSVEHGYLRLAAAMQHHAAGDLDGALADATGAAEAAERFGDADLFALAVHEQGMVRVLRAEIVDGLALLDEAMVSVTANELSPIVTGLLYCSVLDGCQQVYALRRAREWTDALGAWCEQQPDMVAFTGPCLIHRAEILQLGGAWAEALEEARRAEGRARRAAGQAFYRQGELHRLRGDHAAAEAAYREASRAGWEPQPGLALVRLAQGRTDAAAAAIRSVVAGSTDPLRRAKLLPACVEIMLAAGDLGEARRSADELETIAAGYDTGVPGALVAHARGAVALAAGDARASLVPLREAQRAWQELDVPYEAARVRELAARACRALGDEDSAALELEAARATFARLGAAGDLARLDGAQLAHGLSRREIQVLRLVAGGKTNRAIAAELVLSERTVDRHVSNILAKLRVPSRAAATAYAYEHQLV
jgi:DNA-binding CsgD family transcriptional regulator/tetratricopeptide (TPR) repeat protein